MLTLTGNPGTAARTVTRGECNGQTPTRVRLTVRATSATVKKLFVRAVDLGSGTDVYSKYLPVSEQSSVLDIPITVGASGLFIGIDTLVNANPGFVVDQVDLIAPASATTTTTTPPITTTPPTTTTPSTTIPSDSTVCTENFDAGPGRWAPWWSGSVSVQQSAPYGGVLSLSGNPGTTTRTITRGECNGQTPTRIRLTVRSANANVRQVFVRVVDLSNATTTYSNFVPISSQQSVIDIPINVGASGLLIGIDSIVNASPGLTIDQVDLIAPIDTPSATVCTENFDAGPGRWAPWWSGSVSVQQSAPYGGVLSLSGNPGTTTRTITRGECNGQTPTRIRLTVRSANANVRQVFVRVVDLSNATTTYSNFVPISSQQSVIDIPINVGASGLLIGIDSIVNASPGLTIDQVDLIV